ncbi:hypothetical protein AVEN_149334-1 [Araneus ventricosus]|uniref:Uncharacterized protein n=1 Tax=Araneus ventricosus TaxID=182803 RepID=A0A4Y2M3A8_ARAVE|nr:hypothetical protein AVEN_149334-1 [Araneus ventricosus]
MDEGYASTSSGRTLRPTLRGLRTRGWMFTQLVSLKRFTTFKMVYRVGCGPSRKRSRYSLAADFALSPHSIYSRSLSSEMVYQLLHAKIGMMEVEPSEVAGEGTMSCCKED